MHIQVNCFCSPRFPHAMNIWNYIIVSLLIINQDFQVQSNIRFRISEFEMKIWMSCQKSRASSTSQWIIMMYQIYHQDRQTGKQIQSTNITSWSSHTKMLNYDTLAKPIKNQLTQFHTYRMAMKPVQLPYINMPMPMPIAMIAVVMADVSRFSMRLCSGRRVEQIASIREMYHMVWLTITWPRNHRRWWSIRTKSPGLYAQRSVIFSEHVHKYTHTSVHANAYSALWRNVRIFEYMISWNH